MAAPGALMGQAAGDQLCGEGWSHVGLALFVYSVKKGECGCLSVWDLWTGAAGFLLSCLSFPETSTAEPDGLSGIHTHLLRKT